MRSALALALALALTLSACSDSGQPGTTGDSPAEPSPTDGGNDDTVAEGTSLTCWSSPASGESGTLDLVDVTAEAGLVDPLTGMHGHAGIWTDVNGDGIPDLYVGSFADRPDDVYQLRGADGPSPDRLLFGDGTAFSIADIEEMRTRTSGGVGADLDGDGDTDLVVSRNIKDAGLGQPATMIFANDDGRLSPVGDGGLPTEFGGRSVGVLDFDGDGLLDLFIVEDRFTGGSSRLFRNVGALRFEDATAAAGLPDDIHGLGVAVADLDGDGWSDVFVSGSNRLFLSAGAGGFAEADGSVFVWELYGNEDDVAGVSVADVNRDGLLDLAVGHHFNSTVDDGRQVSVRLYLNQGDGAFVDVTEEAGLTPLPTKAPHVELVDLDNDGWTDLLTSASAGDGPAVFLGEGVEGGVPSFITPERIGDVQYWVAAPTADYDRDGRRDVFLVEWEPSLPSLLLNNRTEGGHWIEVSIDSDYLTGIGWTVEVYDGDELIGARPITVTEGYSSGVQPIAHFGLGSADSVRVKLIPPHGEAPIVVDDVAADQHIRWPDGCG